MPLKKHRRRNRGLVAALLLLPLLVAAIAWVSWSRSQQEIQPEVANIAEQVAQKLPVAPAPPVAISRALSALGQIFPGDVGIAVSSVGDGWTTGYNADKIFPQQSVSKLWVAAATLDQVDKGAMRLADPVALSAKDLTIFHQPVRKYILAGNYTTNLGELMRYAMTQSDNTANDVLYRRVGGQQGVGGFIARKTLGQIAIGPGEKILQVEAAGMSWDDSYSYGRNFWIARSRLPPDHRARALSRYLAQPPDGATPEAIAKGLVKLQRGELLSPASTAYLIDLMGQSKTGPDRLRGALIEGDGWSFAHKTGTGQVLGSLATAYNDVGLLRAPSGHIYAVVVMIGSTRLSVKARQEMMHAVMFAVKDCEKAGDCR
jgi:beta-lactamase class A